MRFLYIALGHICVILGIIGIPTPLLPTTPFLLLAAFLYSKGSNRFHNWLLSHPKLGPPIHKWRKYGTINKKAKYTAIFLVLVNVSFPVFIIDVAYTVKVISAVVAAGVITFLATRPHSPPDKYSKIEFREKINQ